MNGDLLGVSFETLFLSVRKTLSSMMRESNTYKEIKPEQRLKRLLDTVRTVGDIKILNQQLMAEVYKKQWQEFLSHGRTNLEKRAIRYLCWDTDVALHPKFINYINSSGIKLSAQSIYALVRACHMKWNSPYVDKNIIAKIREIVRDYKGHNKLLNKWKDNIDLILSIHSTSKLADLIVEGKLNLSEFFEEWEIDIQSNFTEEIVMKASTLCREKYNDSGEYCDYYINQILNWKSWELSNFKKEIAEAILSVKDDDTREKLKVYILSSEKLGDPRLPRNVNWIGIPNNAKEIFIAWLSRRDIVFFFEHVLPTGVDRHKRKEFWLRYVKKLKASRPLLCREDFIILKDKIKREQINYGYISGNNSAFILDFGDIVAVEFSRVGACYIYEKEQFSKFVKDLFGNKWFKESSLKNNKIAIGRIVHLLTSNRDWRKDVSNILARYGIRT